jgi:hypothetical protein
MSNNSPSWRRTDDWRVPSVAEQSAKTKQKAGKSVIALLVGSFAVVAFYGWALFFVLQIFEVDSVSLWESYALSAIYVLVRFFDAGMIAQMQKK